MPYVTKRPLPSKSYRWPISFLVPSETEPGVLVSRSMELIFADKTAAAIKTIEENVSLAYPKGGYEAETEFLKSVVVGWSQIQILDAVTSTLKDLDFSFAELTLECQRKSFRVAALAAFKTFQGAA